MIYESYYGDIDFETGDLCHHGIKGQKWGIRRFQNEDGTRTAAGKARRSGEWQEYVTKVKDRVDAAANKMKELHAAHKEIKRQKKEAKLVKDTEEAVKSGDLDRINKYKSNMSVSQLQEAVNRARLNQQLVGMDTKVSFVKKSFDAIKTMTDYANTISGAYDAAKKLTDKFKEPETELPQDVKNNIQNSAKDYAKYVSDNTAGDTAKKDAAYATAYQRHMERATEAAKEAISNDKNDTSRKSKKVVATIDAQYEYDKIKTSNPKVPEEVMKTIKSNAKDYAERERSNTKGSATDKDAAYTTAYKRYLDRSTEAAMKAVDSYKDDPTKMSIADIDHDKWLEKQGKKKKK